MYKDDKNKYRLINMTDNLNNELNKYFNNKRDAINVFNNYISFCCENFNTYLKKFIINKIKDVEAKYEEKIVKLFTEIEINYLNKYINNVDQSNRNNNKNKRERRQNNEFPIRNLNDIIIRKSHGNL